MKLRNTRYGIHTLKRKTGKNVKKLSEALDVLEMMIAECEEEKRIDSSAYSQNPLQESNCYDQLIGEIGEILAKENPTEQDMKRYDSLEKRAQKVYTITLPKKRYKEGSHSYTIAEMEGKYHGKHQKEGNSLRESPGFRNIDDYHGSIWNL